MSKNTLRPDYYGGKDNPFEVIKIIQWYKLCFSLGNVIKYVLRAGNKDKSKEIEDLEKAREYLDFRINELKAIQEKERADAFKGVIGATMLFKVGDFNDKISEVKTQIQKIESKRSEKPDPLQWLIELNEFQLKNNEAYEKRYWAIMRDHWKLRAWGLGRYL